MNTSRQIFGSNSSDHLLFNDTEMEMIAVDIITILLGFPINSYVIWLIVTGTGNGLAAEFFSLNYSVCEMLYCLECLLNLISYKVESLWIVSNFLDGLFLTSRPLFQSLICVERYLAVVYPVTFLKFKPLRYRLICSVIAWVASLVSGGIGCVTVFFFLLDVYYVIIMAEFSSFLCIHLFCLVVVLRALKQSGPGDRRREEENILKRRAFLFIVITTVTTPFLFFPYMISLAVSASVNDGQTVLSFGLVCLTLAGLVQPLLFLYRVRKPSIIKC